MLTKQLRKQIDREIEASHIKRDAKAKANKVAGYPEVKAEAQKWLKELDVEQRDALSRLFGKDAYSCYRGYVQANQRRYHKIEGSKI